MKKESIIDLTGESDEDNKKSVNNNNVKPQANVIDLTNENEDKDINYKSMLSKSKSMVHNNNKPKFNPHAPNAPVCIGQISSMALIMMPSGYILDPNKWKTVRLAYVPITHRLPSNNALVPKNETIRIYPPAEYLGHPPNASMGASNNDSFGVMDRRTAGVLGPLMLQRCVRIEGKIQTREGNPMMLPLKLLVFTRRDIIDRIASVLFMAGIVIEKPFDYVAENHSNVQLILPSLSTTQSQPPPIIAGPSNITLPQQRPIFNGNVRSVDYQRSQLNEVFESMNVGDLLETEANERICSTLYPHQKQALTFLLERECEPTRPHNQADKFSFWKTKFDYDGRRKYQHIITHTYADTEPEGCRGALLADDMGLGKTISVVCLIASTIESSKKFGNDKLVKPKFERIEREEPLKAPNPNYFAGSVYGMPISNNGMLDQTYKQLNEDEEDEEVKDKRIRYERLRHRTKGSLIICPLSTLSNWEEQFVDHMEKKPKFYRNDETPKYDHKDDDDRIHIYIYHGNNRKREASFLRKFDIILTAFSTVATEYSKQENAIKKLEKAKEIYNEKCNKTISLDDDDDDQQSTSIASSSDLNKVKSTVSSKSSSTTSNRKGKRRKKDEYENLENVTMEMIEEFKENVQNSESPLQQLEWFRIVLDEAHYIKDSNTMISKAACDLLAQRRLCLSGTPIQNKIEDVYALLKFLHLEPFDDRNTWNYFIGNPIKLGRNVGFARIQILMKHMTLRRTKDMKNKDGSAIVALPDRKDEIRTLEFNSKERAIYDDQHGRSKERYMELRDNDQLIRGGFINILQEILRLRMICDHYCLVPDAVSAFAQSPISQARAIFQVMRDSGVANCYECNYDFVNPTSTTNVNNIKEDDDNDDMKFNKRLKIDNNSQPSTPLNQILPIVNLQCNHIICSICINKVCKLWPTNFEPFHCNECSELVEDENKLIQIDNFNESFTSLKSIDDEVENDEFSEKKKKKKVTKPEEYSSKIQALLMDLVEISSLNPHSSNYNTLNFENNNEDPIKTIVFSQWTSMLDLVEYGLKQYNIGFGRLDGSMQRDQRADSLERLKNDPTCEVLLISLRAGGVGLNLTAANRVYMMDSWWNVAVENQAVDRVCRIGQKRKVHVTRFIIQNSIEERILQIQERKTQLFKGVLGVAARDKTQERKEMLENLEILFGEK